MDCLHWGSGETSRRRRRTARGSRTSACRACRRTFNERTGTPVNDLQYPTDIVLLAVLWRLRYTRSFRDVAALLLERGFGVTHATIRMWAFRRAPLRADRLRAKRRGCAGVSGSIDETSVKVAGRWCALYRASDRDGDPGLHAQRAPRSARRPALPAAPGGRGPAQAAARHDGPAAAGPQSDPRDPGERRCGTDAASTCTTSPRKATGPASSAMTPGWASGVSRPPPGSVPRSMSSGRTSAFANDRADPFLWSTSDSFSSRAGDHESRRWPQCQPADRGGRAARHYAWSEI